MHARLRRPRSIAAHSHTGVQRRLEREQCGIVAHSQSHSRLSFLFDLDGTLIDSVYQHVIAWREALQEVGINLAVWKIHRRIGMSGGSA
jgi:hypothetical protein